MNHALELSLIFISFVVVTILTILTPKTHDIV
jgi:hypothetical protein